jgi:hypothetical protein
MEDPVHGKKNKQTNIDYKKTRMEDSIQIKSQIFRKSRFPTCTGCLAQDRRGRKTLLSSAVSQSMKTLPRSGNFRLGVLAGVPAAIGESVCLGV